MAKEWNYSEDRQHIVLNEPPKQRLRITGHRMASVLGLNPYQTPFGAWAEITKLVKLPFEDTKYTLAGKAIEPKLIDLIAKKFPNTMSIEEYYGNNIDTYRYNNFVNDSNVFGGVMDAVCTEDDMKTLTAIIECKTSSKPQEWENNNVPITHLLQGAEYAYLKGIDRIVFICAFLQDDDYNHPEQFKPTEKNTIIVVKKLKDIVVDVNGKLMTFEDIIKYCEEWWNNHIEKGVSPRFDEIKDKEYLDIMRETQPGNDNDLDSLINYASFLQDEINTIRKNNLLDNLEKTLKTVESSIKEKMMELLGENETKVQYGTYKLSGTVSKKFDEKLFKQDHPKTYENYMKDSITYRLTKVKEKGEDE